MAKDTDREALIIGPHLEVCPGRTFTRSGKYYTCKKCGKKLG